MSILLLFCIPQAAAAPIAEDTDPPLWTVALVPTGLLNVSPPTPSPRKRSTLDATLARIAVCESQNKAHATNPTSTAKGRFQFLDGTWRRYAREYWGSSWTKHSPFNSDDATELAYYVARTYGLDDWASSRGCWAEA